MTKRDRFGNRRNRDSTDSSSTPLSWSSWEVGDGPRGNGNSDSSTGGSVGNEAIIMNQAMDIELDPNAEQEEEDQEQEIQATSSSIILVTRILKGIPQSPHFLPLKNKSDDDKKTEIEKWDRRFEQTVDELQGLRASELWVNARRIWETLGELEMMGYNVLCLRRRLVDLTRVVKTQEILKSLMMKMEARVKQTINDIARLKEGLPVWDDIFNMITNWDPWVKFES